MIQNRKFRYALCVYLTVRILLSIVGYLASTTYPKVKPIPAGGYEKPVHAPWFENIAGFWEHADSLWFFHIARDGYTGDSDAAFFPLYPLLVRIVKWITFLPWILCGLIVSNLAMIFALYFLYLLCEIDYGEKAAEQAVWFQALVPGTVFLFAAYSESLYLLLAIASLYFVRRERWFAAAATASLLCLTRNTGVLILLPLALECKSHFRKALLPLSIVILTVGGYALFWYFKTGDPVAFIHSQDGWGRQPMFPLLTLWEGLVQGWTYRNSAPGGIYALEAILLMVILIIGGLSIKRIRASYLVFLFLSLVPPLCAPYPGHMLMSFVRFLSVLFPVSISLGIFTKSPKLGTSLFVTLAALSSLVAVMFITGQSMF